MFLNFMLTCYITKLHGRQNSKKYLYDGRPEMRLRCVEKERRINAAKNSRYTIFEVFNY